MRALVTIFAALLIGISVYQLSFTWFVNRYESTVHQKAEKNILSQNLPAVKKYPADKDQQALYQDTLNALIQARFRRLLDSTKDTKITWWGTSYQKSKESNKRWC